MGPVHMGSEQMQTEEQEPVEPLIHRSVGVYGANYYTTACGLYDGTYYVHRSKNEITCPRCRSIVIKENR